MLRLGFLASHGGSNFQSVVDAIRAGRLGAIAAVLLCNNRGAEAVQRAQREGLPAVVLNGVTHPDAAALDAAMLAVLREHAVDWVVLAGYMKKIGPAVLAAYHDRIINIHPALLPKFGGQGMYGRRVHEAVLAAREIETGVTIHLVDEHYDHGRILAQTRVPVQVGDTVEVLAARVLAREHEFLVETISEIERGNVR